MGVKTIKGVDETAWAEFRSLAAKNRMRSGDFFNKLVDSYKADEEEAWGKILGSKKILSDEEADDIQKIVRELRKEKGFRE